MSNEAQAELERIHHLLWEFAGATAWEKVTNALLRIEYLTRMVSVSEHNERATMDVLRQDRLELFVCRSKIRMARECMQANDPLNARVIFGAEELRDGNPRTEPDRVPVGKDL